MEHPDHDPHQFYEDFLVENDQSKYTDLESEANIHQEAINPDWYPAYFPTDLQLGAEIVPWETGPREAEISNNLNHLFPVLGFDLAFQSQNLGFPNIASTAQQLLKDIFGKSAKGAESMQTKIVTLKCLSAHFVEFPTLSSGIS